MTEQTRIDTPRQADGAKTATLHRMVMPGHTCPYGLKARHLLKRKGYAVDDRWLTTREETDRFKAEHGVKTTPQVFIGGKRVGGYDDLRRFFGLRVADPNAASYTPVLVVFAITAAILAKPPAVPDGYRVLSRAPQPRPGCSAPRRPILAKGCKRRSRTAPPTGTLTPSYG